MERDATGEVVEMRFWKLPKPEPLILADLMRAFEARFGSRPRAIYHFKDAGERALLLGPVPDGQEGR